MTDASLHLVRFEGSLTVAVAEAAHARLSAALMQADPVVVDCADATEVDLTFVQLLIAARRSADASGQRFVLATPAAGALRQVLVAAGVVGTDPFWSGDAAHG